MLRIDRYNFEIACAGQCMNPPDVIAKAGLPADTEKRIADGDELTPADVGKLAAALKVKPKEIAVRTNYGMNLLE